MRCEPGPSTRAVLVTMPKPLALDELVETIDRLARGDR
jgi:hypothetical protein